jgi:hypothetical protein
MEWCAYLISIPAAVVLGQAALAFFSRPLRLALLLRQSALECLEVFRGMPLPKPRHLAACSQDIPAYDQALRNLKGAERAFADLGAQFLALSEGEPAMRGCSLCSA